MTTILAATDHLWYAYYKANAKVDLICIYNMTLFLFSYFYFELNIFPVVLTVAY